MPLPAVPELEIAVYIPGHTGPLVILHLHPNVQVRFFQLSTLEMPVQIRGRSWHVYLPNSTQRTRCSPCSQRVDPGHMSPERLLGKESDSDTKFQGIR